MQFLLKIFFRNDSLTHWCGKLRLIVKCDNRWYTGVEFLTGGGKRNSLYLASVRDRKQKIYKREKTKAQTA